jgi:hypothetical protein
VNATALPASRQIWPGAAGPLGSVRHSCTGPGRPVSPGSLARKASLLPSGDQRGCQAWPGPASRSQPGEPSVPSRKIRRDSAARPATPSSLACPDGCTKAGPLPTTLRSTQVTARVLPSGDHASSATSPGTAASRCSADELGCQRAGCADPLAELIRASRPPSGDHRGHQASATLAEMAACFSPVRVPASARRRRSVRSSSASSSRQGCCWLCGSSTTISRRVASATSSSHYCTKARSPSGASLGSLTSFSRPRSPKLRTCLVMSPARRQEPASAGRSRSDQTLGAFPARR